MKKKERKKSIKALLKKLDSIFSIYIRLRDKGVCYTCGYKNKWKLMDAGHYIKRQHLSLRFDERNVHCQCRSCNRFKGGKMDDYAARLVRQYGPQIIIEFDKKKRQIKKFKTAELEKLIALYQNKVKTLKGLYL